MGNKIRVGLVYGGKSGEHDVSLQTALAVIKAFDHQKYEIHPFYITKQGHWRTGPNLSGPVVSVASLTFEPLDHVDSSSMESYNGSTAVGAKQSAVRAIGSIFAQIEQSELVKTRSSGTLDVVFPLLHGTFGEDGTIQGMLEMADIPYVGAGVLASSVGMDKVMMKKVFAQEGLPQCLYRHFTRVQWEKDETYYLMEMERALGYPCFVKPANLGSSVGISKARNRMELHKAITFALQYDRKIIVEEFIDAREIEVSVLGNDSPETSIPGEIVPCNEFYDYKAKYVDGKSEMVIPADLPVEMIKKLQQLAISAFEAIDCSGLARVDFFVSRSDHSVYINEINTMPGFTPFSMYPLLWRESGKSYAELLDQLIQLAMQRHEQKQRIQFSFDVG